jgi:hypothetical protein
MVGVNVNRNTLNNRDLAAQYGDRSKGDTSQKVIEKQAT